jgi:hypothetical protein
MLQLHAFGHATWRRTTSFTSTVALRALLTGVCLLACLGSARAQASLDAMVTAEAGRQAFPRWPPQW